MILQIAVYENGKINIEKKQGRLVNLENELKSILSRAISALDIPAGLLTASLPTEMLIPMETAITILWWFIMVLLKTI